MSPFCLSPRRRKIVLGAALVALVAACSSPDTSVPGNIGAFCGSRTGESSAAVSRDCPAGFGDCDGDPANGCEADLRNDAANCGACRQACVGAHASGVCGAGVCSLTCLAGFADCNKDVKDGCEVSTDTSAANCGACGKACSANHATPSCRSATCAPVCDAGFGDCDGDAANGCETPLATDLANCGACGQKCKAIGGTATCAAGACGITCDTGLADCDGNLANGCETTLAASLDNCGACAKICGKDNALATCTRGTCGLVCSTGYADCDRVNANGCESFGPTDPNNCGSCGIVCPVACNRSACVSLLALSLGADHTFATLSDSSMRAFGSNDKGQLTLAPSAPVLTPVPAPSVGDGSVSPGRRYTCEILSNGSLECFGANGSGQLGDGTTIDRPAGVFPAVRPPLFAVAGTSHTCAQASSGLFCWGSNSAGEIGIGTFTATEPTPRQVTGIAQGAQQIVIGDKHTCVLSSGQVLCWGADAQGECGDGAPGGNQPNPVTVMTAATSPLANVAQIAAGASHTCARLNDSTIWCWGAGGNGQLGNGGTANQVFATQVPGIANANQVVSGSNHVCVSLSDGTGRCWGAGALGQMGNGGTTAVNPSPVQVTGLPGGILQIWGAGDRTCAFPMPGPPIMCWGANDQGQLGTGTTTNALVPTPPKWH